MLVSVLVSRSARSSFGGLGGVDAWWAWSLTTLLDGLYQHGPSSASTPAAQVGFPLPLTVLSSQKSHVVVG